MNFKIAIFMLLAACACAKAEPVVESAKVEIPQRGNTFVTSCSDRNFIAGAARIIDTYTGEIKDWSDSDDVISLFFKAGASGRFALTVNAIAGDVSDSSDLRFSMADGQSHTVKISGGDYRDYVVGEFHVTSPGYVRVDIQGLRKTGERFGDIRGFTLQGPAVDGETHFLPADRPDDVYWTRRGPSVHLNYVLPAEDIEYFYSEVVVPEGSDVHGTYFMLTGFGEGYMGIQSIKDENGRNNNRVLFSVWSPFSTDNPDEIPDSLHVRVLGTSEGVTAQNFGNEGSGKQSFMHYPWQAGKTYRTLVRVCPDGKGNTVYTGYFGDENGNWHLLSRLLRPATDTYYKRPHSFLECFIPETSVNTRSVQFKNQWARDRYGVWHEVTEATFTCDNTGRSGVRVDMAGGVVGDAFMLKNCGFFNDATGYKTRFVRKGGGEEPQIDALLNAVR